MTYHLSLFLQGDIVVRQGDLGSEMYFIGEGVLEARIYEDDKGSPLSKATYVRSMTRNQVQQEKRRKKSAAAVHSRRPSEPAAAGKAGQLSVDVSAAGGSDSIAATGDNHWHRRWSISIQQAADAAVHVARCSWLGKSLFPNHSSDGGIDPGGSKHQQQQVPSSSAKGSKGSDLFSSDNGHRSSAPCKGNQAETKTSSPAYGDECPLMLPNKKLLDKYTYVDELGSRKFRCVTTIAAVGSFGLLTVQRRPLMYQQVACWLFDAAVVLLQASIVTCSYVLVCCHP